MANVNVSASFYCRGGKRSSRCRVQVVTKKVAPESWQSKTGSHIRGIARPSLCLSWSDRAESDSAGHRGAGLGPIRLSFDQICQDASDFWHIVISRVHLLPEAAGRGSPSQKVFGDCNGLGGLRAAGL